MVGIAAEGEVVLQRNALHGGSGVGKAGVGDEITAAGMDESDAIAGLEDGCGASSDGNADLCASDIAVSACTQCEHRNGRCNRLWQVEMQSFKIGNVEHGNASSTHLQGIAGTGVAAVGTETAL